MTFPLLPLIHCLLFCFLSSYVTCQSAVSDFVFKRALSLSFCVSGDSHHLRRRGVVLQRTEGGGDETFEQLLTSKKQDGV